MAQVPMSSTKLDTYPVSAVAGARDQRADLAAVRGNLFDGEAVDRVYRGHGPGVQLLAVTSQRIMMVETSAWGGRLALTSVPFGRLTAVSFLADENHPIDRATTIGIRVTSLAFELVCADAEQAREAHDLISWTLIH
jgi:hypothetical protein